MPMLICPHHVMWIVPVAEGKHMCSMCREIVRKTETLPKISELPELEAKWDAHEKTGPAPAPAPAAKIAPKAAPAAPKPAAAAAPAPAAPAPAAAPSQPTPTEPPKT